MKQVPVPVVLNDMARVFMEMVDYTHKNGNGVSERAETLMSTRFCREKIINDIFKKLKKRHEI